MTNMDFPPNRKDPLGMTKEVKEPPPPKVVEKVVTVDAIQKKKSIGRRFKGIFLGGEFKGAFTYIVTDVLLPAFRNMVVDATSKGVERMVYGDAPRRRYDAGRPSRYSYNTPVDRGYRSAPRTMLPDQPPLPARPRRQEVGEIILVSRDEAELVIERLSDIIDKYEVASIADLHDLVGLPTTYVDNKWGWAALQYATVRQVREGYLLDLPPVEPI